MQEIIIDPICPKPKRTKQKLTLISRSSDRSRKTEQAPAFYKDMQLIEHTEKMQVGVSVCESIILDENVKVTSSGQIVEIDDIKRNELVDANQGNENVLIRSKNNDTVISEVTTYINTSTKDNVIVNIAQRDAMPRGIKPIYEYDTDNYIYKVIKRSLGGKFCKNVLYIVKTSTFRMSDVQTTQKLIESVSNIEQYNAISDTVKLEVQAISSKLESLKSPYADIMYDRQIGIMHCIYSIRLDEIAGYGHEIGSTYISNLDICINIGTHQDMPVHPTRMNYENLVCYNPGYVDKTSAQVFTGYTYYDEDDKKSVYAIVGGSVVKIQSTAYPYRTDCANDKYTKPFIRVYNHRGTEYGKSHYIDEQSNLIVPAVDDIDLIKALESTIVYATYDEAVSHLNKFGTSVSVDLVKSKQEIAASQAKLKELEIASEVAQKKYDIVLAETKSLQEQTAIKTNTAQFEANTKMQEETIKLDRLKEEIKRDIQSHEHKMQSSKYSQESDVKINGFKTFAAVMTTAAAGFTLFKAFAK